MVGRGRGKMQRERRVVRGVGGEASERGSGVGEKPGEK
jgi:hypothetical protein